MEASSHALSPSLEVARHLQVDDPHHATARGGHRSVADRQILIARSRLLEPHLQREGIVLAQHARLGQAVAIPSGGIDPACVHVSGQDHHGPARRHRVQNLCGGLVLPHRVPVPVPDQRVVRVHLRHHPCRDALGCGLRAARPGQVHAPAHDRPLGEVDVVIPQARDEPPAIESEGLDAGRPRAAHGGDPSSGHQDVDGLVRTQEASVGEEQVSHERRFLLRSMWVAGAGVWPG